MISDADLAHLQRLARIAFPPSEMARLKKDFAEILSFVGVLNAVEIDGVEEMTHAQSETNVMRPDAEGSHAYETAFQETLHDAEAVKKNFPKQTDGLLEVNSVFS